MRGCAIKNILQILSVGLFALLAGCGDTPVSSGSSTSTSSLKPSSQRQFEDEIRQLNSGLTKASPGTRQYEQASEAIQKFWDDKSKTLARVDGWVCVYSNTTPWDPKTQIENPNRSSGNSSSDEADQYRLLGSFCTDPDKPLGVMEIGRGGEMTIVMKVSKAPNLERLFYGDVIQVSGSVERDWSSGVYRVRPYELAPSFKIWIDADSISIVKKGS